MNVCVLSEQQRSCFAYNAESEPQHVSKPTVEQQDSFNISTLELWKSIGKEDLQVVDDLYSAHKKRQKMEVTANEKNDQDIIANAKLNVEKASDELQQLVFLSSLLKSNEYITLQTCNRSEIQDRGYGLSVIQNLDILRSNFHTAHTTFETGLQHTVHVITNRNAFADSLLSLKKHWKLSFVDGRTGKRVPHFDPSNKLHRIVVDCSLPFSATSESIDSACHVPLRISEDGSLTLCESEVKRVHYTLTLSIELGDSDSTQTVAMVSAWESQSISVNDGSTVDIHKHCVARQHEASCKALFTRIVSECVGESSDGWVSGCSAHTTASGSASHSLLFDKLELPLTVRFVDHLSVSVKLSEGLTLRVALTPSSSVENRTNSAEEHQWLFHALSCCLTNAQRALHDSSSMPVSCRDSGHSLSRHIEQIRMAKNRTALQLVIGEPNRSVAAVTSSEGIKIIWPLMCLLRAKFSHHRVRHAVRAATERCLQLGLLNEQQEVKLVEDRGSNEGVALADQRTAVVSLRGAVVLVVDVDGAGGALATVQRSADVAKSSPGTRVIAPVLKTLRQGGDKGALIRTSLDTIAELQAWMERAIALTHFRLVLVQVAKAGNHPIEVMVASPSSLALKAKGRLLRPSLATLRLVPTPINKSAPFLQLDITLSDTSQTAAFKSHLHTLSVACSDVPIIAIATGEAGDSMEVDGAGENERDMRTLRIEWRASLDSLKVFDKLMSISCTL